MAESNGIVIGENIFSISKEKDFFSSVSDRTNNSGDAFIFRNESENFFYKQYDFHWLNFLKAQDFIATDLAGNLRIKRKKNLYKDIENLKPLIRDNRPYLPKNGS